MSATPTGPAWPPALLAWAQQQGLQPGDLSYAQVVHRLLLAVLAQRQQIQDLTARMAALEAKVP